jgi:hypothetical protein
MSNYVAVFPQSSVFRDEENEIQNYKMICL